MRARMSVEPVTSSRRRKGTTIRNREHESIKSIIEQCNLESRRKCLQYPMRQATKQVVRYTRVSERTIKRIHEEVKLGIELADEPTR